MGKTDQRIAKGEAFSKHEILEGEDRKAQKHRRKQFSEYLAEDEDFQSFSLSKSDIELDDETLKRYLKG